MALPGKAQDVAQVGRDLGARYVVEGSVRRAGERVRITAQLIESSAGHHLWAKRYDRDLSDIFALQDEITREIVASIEPQLNRAEKRIGAVAVDPAPPVHTAWDPGAHDATAIWFYRTAGREVRLIDYYEASGYDASGAEPDHDVRELQQRGYRDGERVLPHDARAPEPGSGKTRIETLQGLGIWPRVLPVHRREEGINEVRRQPPRCWFDEQKCARGIA